MKIRIAGFEKESVVDGPGIRFVIFAQGCPHHCPGCHNSHTWDFEGGQEMDIGELIKLIRSTKLIRGVTFSGGEPFIQAKAFTSLGEKLKEIGLDIVTYTGYTFEELLEKSKKDQEIQQLLELSDIIVDGRFVKEERDISIPFRGSRNQRLILVSPSLASGKIIQVDI